MPPKLHIHLTLLALPILLLLALPAITHAGTYKVYSCKLPDGSPAPTDGWYGVQRKTQFSDVADNCRFGGALDAVLNGDFGQPNDSHVGWRFDVPSDLTLQSFRVWRHFSLNYAPDYNATPVAFMAWPGPNLTPDSREDCVGAFGCTELGTSAARPDVGDLREFDGLGSEVRSIWLWAGCGGSADCSDRNSANPLAQVNVKAFEAHLQDRNAPEVSDVEGPLARKRHHGGVESIAFRASDTGAGVYRSIVELRSEKSANWSQVDAEVIDGNDGDCRDARPDDLDPYEFVKRVPCKAQLGSNLSLDTRSIPNGAHELRVSVEDASGNRTPALGPMPFNVTNRESSVVGAPEPLGLPTNGTGASNATRLTVSKALVRAGRKLKYGQRFKVVATVRNERGEPVRGARVQVLQRQKLPKAKYRTARKPLTTGANGKVRWTVPAGTSRTLRLAYKANVFNYSYQSVTDVPLVVQAATTLRRDKRSYSNGQTIRFSGKVRSKPIPEGGILIDLQAYKRGTGWVTFATRRTRAGGRWAINYRLTSTSRSTRYRFRARVRQDTGYAYAAGRSKATSVLVTP